MASIKLKFHEPKTDGKEGRIYFQISADGKTSLIASPYTLFPHEWDSRRAKVIALPAETVSTRLNYINMSLRREIIRIKHIIHKAEDLSSGISISELADTVASDIQLRSLPFFMKSVMETLRINGNIRTAETYRVSLNCFMKFFRQVYNDLPEGILSNPTIDDITPDLMERYQSFLTVRGLSSNTISFYMRTLRAVYNRAVDKGLATQSMPFRRVYTGVGRTMKRALPTTLISRLKSMDLTRMPDLEYARDIFMLSFYLRGMSFVDMAFLKKTDLTDNHVTYTRRKTGQKLTIAWTCEMETIVNKYHTGNSRFLLPVISNKTSNEWSAYRNAGYSINKRLRRIGQMIGSPIRLTLYVARHSWASTARSKGIPLGVISEGMGHESESTTRIYLASLDNAIVDRANALIIQSI